MIDLGRLDNKKGANTSSKKLFCPQEITFRMTRPLTDFMATLHKNGVEEKKLSKYVTHRVTDDFVTIGVAFPEDGQVKNFFIQVLANEAS
jgi:hypothetical protein